MFPLRYSFGLNTNIFETNVLNLAVVVGIVITFVGDAIRVLLDQRRKTILSALQEVDEKVKDAQRRIEEANKKLDQALVRTEDIRKQTERTIEEERQTRRKKLEEDINRIKERGLQSIQLERQRIIQDITIKVGKLAIIAAENTLLAALDRQSPSCSKQKDLNEAYMREVFCMLKE